MMTIGQLAKQMGVRPSTLRYYEKEGLIEPDGRTEAGYRLYGDGAAQTIYLIQRAQRLGFSLADIRSLLAGWQTGDLNNRTLIETAEARYLALEKQVTKMLILRHELAHFLQDLHEREAAEAATVDNDFDELIGRVCVNPEEQKSSDFMLNWLMTQHQCQLSSVAGQAILRQLRGQHVHIWQDEETYHILLVSDDPAVGRALERLAQLEDDCETHDDVRPEVIVQDEGVLFKASGESGFLFARLFLALAQEDRGEGEN